MLGVGARIHGSALRGVGVRGCEFLLCFARVEASDRSQPIGEDRQRAAIHLRESAIEEEDVGSTGTLDAEPAFAEANEERRCTRSDTLLTVPCGELDVRRFGVEDALGGGDNVAAKLSHGAEIVRPRVQWLKAIGERAAGRQRAIDRPPRGQCWTTESAPWPYRRSGFRAFPRSRAPAGQPIDKTDAKKTPPERTSRRAAGGKGHSDSVCELV